MPRYANTLLEQTCQAAVSRQIEYGRQRAVPWGISESCYNAVDLGQAYQYRAFGVPGLGFKRGLGDDLVIAPYASALALLVAPSAACRNLERLASEGFLGAHVVRVTVDGVAAAGAGMDETGRPQGVIPLVDDRQEHYITVDLSSMKVAS